MEDTESVCDNAVADNKLNLNRHDVWALGITIVIGGQYFAWNEGLSAGFGSFAVATTLVACAYVCLVLSIAELSSALPFAGGSYGIARVTIGIYPGYLVACCDSIESVMYVAVSAVYIGTTVTSITHWPASLEPLYWLFFYVSALLIQIRGGKAFWNINKCMAGVSLLIILIYILGSVGNTTTFQQHAAWEEGASGEVYLWFRGGPARFIKVLPLACWFFVGVESINLACKDVHHPRSTIPVGYLSCVGTLFCTGFGVLLVAVTQRPGVERLQSASNPLEFGFMDMFGCSREAATALSLPALYATAFGFLFCYGRQLRSMGKSGLLNHLMGHDLHGRGSPDVALLVGSGVGFVICFLIWLVPAVGKEMFNVSMLGAFGAYFSQFCSFVEFRRKYKNSIRRSFVSPLGVPGAVFGCVVFGLCFVSVCGFQGDQSAIIVFVLYLAAVSVYYHLVVMQRQFFSEEEKVVLFRAHLMKNNRARAARLQRKVKPRRARSILKSALPASIALAMERALAVIDDSSVHSTSDSTGEPRRSPGQSLRQAGEGDVEFLERVHMKPSRSHAHKDRKLSFRSASAASICVEPSSHSSRQAETSVSLSRSVGEASIEEAVLETEEGGWKGEGVTSEHLSPPIDLEAGLTPLANPAEEAQTDSY